MAGWTHFESPGITGTTDELTEIDDHHRCRLCTGLPAAATKPGRWIGLFATIVVRRSVAGPERFWPCAYFVHKGQKAIRWSRETATPVLNVRIPCGTGLSAG